MEKTEPPFPGFSFSCCGYCGLEGSVGFPGDAWRDAGEEGRIKGRDRKIK